MPRILNCRTEEPTPGAVYVGRKRRFLGWGNPFVIGKDGTRSDVIAKFRTYALERLEQDSQWLNELKGKDLICWCAPEACHAEVLLELANGPEIRFR